MDGATEGIVEIEGASEGFNDGASVGVVDGA